ncbi:hypothetical protein QA601_02735 [Chitinispirillales bacterium ANBcel5]|uniref:hypothetical protein n=1 Tax=Cellulosispirillum alkaliphilum TaxID=3039283 RepID=UPI002A572674|nr:hypothetical protein [Chitinispirillales bacterium ANBcel5]
MAELVEKYGEDLKNSRIDHIYLKTVCFRAGTFTHAVAQVDSCIKEEKCHISQFQELKREAFNLRKGIVDRFEYIFESAKQAVINAQKRSNAAV